MFKTPILLLIFNRPDTTKRVLNEIRKQKPQYLYIAADGPRLNNEKDVEECKKCIEIVSAIDWDCNVKTLYREKNLGCGAAPAQAISWFFENVEQGIILEDDILVDQSFFSFCEKMLEDYKNDQSIMHISGSYFLESIINDTSPQSYYFSKHIHVWGWATWKRAWKYYDYDMKDWPSLKSNNLLKLYYNDYAIFWKSIFSKMENKGNDIWDYQWMFAIYKQRGLAINPTVNLTKNIGFDHNATHTTDISSIYTKVKLSSLSTIISPANTGISPEKDILYYRHYLNFDLQSEIAKRKTSWKLRNNLKRLIRKFQTYFK